MKVNIQNCHAKQSSNRLPLGKHTPWTKKGVAVVEVTPLFDEGTLKQRSRPREGQPVSLDMCLFHLLLFFQGGFRSGRPQTRVPSTRGRQGKPRGLESLEVFSWQCDPFRRSECDVSGLSYTPCVPVGQPTAPQGMDFEVLSYVRDPDSGVVCLAPGLGI